ncbi:MAG: filamentous hemagglutinin N-terminal domain-containing protein [Oscillatoriales cyanobacterium]|nr:MAG: filamentous hemagglutinin N-terminal domain-containing protein [Oscillatoriales cyanobacterium]
MSLSFPVKRTAPMIASRLRLTVALRRLCWPAFGLLLPPIGWRGLRVGAIGGGCWVAGVVCGACPIAAQIIPDATLPQVSIVQNRETGAELLGGTIAGSNLFHSFEQFVLQDGMGARFVTPAGIDRVLARVTGSTIAEIDGTLSADTDLIFLAPNGIRFGDQASLDLSGSFIATTAHGINFSDGSTWPSIASETSPLLSVNVPVGLQFNPDLEPGTITAIGSGSAVTVPSTAANLLSLGLLSEAASLSALNPGRSASVLATEPGETLGFVAGQVEIQRMQLDAPSGTIAIGGVRSGEVGLGSLDPAAPGLPLDFATADLSGQIQLRDRAALTASGSSPNGSITLAAETIAINGGAFAQLQNFSDRPGGTLRLTATDTLAIDGTPQDGQGSFVGSETFGSGPGATIVINADRANLWNGASANTVSYATGMSGNLIVDVGDLTVQGFRPGEPGEVSNLSSSTLISGAGGDIKLHGRQLVLDAGGTIFALTTGSGRSGNLQLDIRDGVRLQGTEPDNQGSTLGTATIDTGTAGNVTLNTSQLSLFAGARVGSLSVAVGDAGNVALDSSEFIALSGRDPTLGGSSIASSVESIAISTLLPRSFLETFPNLVDVVPSGDAGNLTIVTPQLLVQDGGQIQVANRGFGNPGRLLVQGDTLRLETGGAIAAETVAGSGGAINLDLRLLEIQNGSIGTATVSTGQGSDIFIRARDRIVVSATSLQETQNQALRLFFSANAIPDFNIGIISGSAGEGKAGNIELETGELILRNGGLITPSALRSGDAGSLTIRVAGDIVIDGGILTTATISQASDAGRGGDMRIDAENLSLINGGTVSTTTLGRNDAGSLTVNVRDQLLIVGAGVANLLSASGLSSGSLRLGAGSVGNGGDLSIQAQRLVLQDQGRISSSSEGQGNAGNINIDVGSLSLDHTAAIVASSNSGEGGNLTIRSQTSAILQNASQLSTQAGSSVLEGGNGGNLLLNAGVFAAIGGSRVSANAFRGSGGQILIEARGFFLGDRSNIDASSQLGIDGVVEVRNDTIVTDPNLVSLSSELLTPNLLAQDCMASNRDRFSIVDRGRTLQILDHTLAASSRWADDRDWRDLTPELESRSGHGLSRHEPIATGIAGSDSGMRTGDQPARETQAAIDAADTSAWSEASHWHYDDHHNVQLSDAAGSTFPGVDRSGLSACAPPAMDGSVNLSMLRRRSP